MKNQILLLILIFCFGLMAGESANPETKLTTYLVKDFNGEFLRQNDWLANHLVNAHVLPAWDEFSVIKSYEIKAIQAHDKTNVITVEYHQLGRLIQDSTGFKFVQDHDTVTAKFTLKKQSSTWKIHHPGIHPQVGITPAKELFPKEVKGL